METITEKIKEYKLVSDEDKETFVNKVNHLIADGYQPYGNPYCIQPFCGARDYCGDDFTIRDDRYETYCQTMVKFEESKTTETNKVWVVKCKYRNTYLAGEGIWTNDIESADKFSKNDACVLAKALCKATSDDAFIAYLY